jgi:hypothetical protein
MLEAIALLVSRLGVVTRKHEVEVPMFVADAVGAEVEAMFRAVVNEKVKDLVARRERGSIDQEQSRT